MFITKTKIFSLFIVLILGIVQLSALFVACPVLADSSLGQPLLQEIGNSSYGTQKDVKIIALDFIKVLLGFLSIIFLAFVLFAGFKWMTSGGNETKIKEATSQMTNAAIGLVILLSAWGITRYILQIALCRTQYGGTCPTNPW